PAAVFLSGECRRPKNRKKTTRIPKAGKWMSVIYSWNLILQFQTQFTASYCFSKAYLPACMRKFSFCQQFAQDSAPQLVRKFLPEITVNPGSGNGTQKGNGNDGRARSDLREQRPGAGSGDCPAETEKQ